MQHKVTKTSRGLVHCIADCARCSWSATDYHTAAREASKHARSTGHVANVEQAFAYSIMPSRRKEG